MYKKAAGIYPYLSVINQQQFILEPVSQAIVSFLFKQQVMVGNKFADTDLALPARALNAAGSVGHNFKAANWNFIAAFQAGAKFIPFFISLPGPLKFLECAFFLAQCFFVNRFIVDGIHS
jgi:hypothetical protein